MHLYLVRHGESKSPDIDPDQPLSIEGKEGTKKVADYLKSTSVELDEIMHSVKTRARQTAEILAHAIAPNPTLIQREGLKPMDPIEPILTEIQSFDRNVMLVGHLPFMERLLTTLLLHKEGPSPVIFYGSCVVCLVGEGHSWQLSWMINPGLLT